MGCLIFSLLAQSKRGELPPGMPEEAGLEPPSAPRAGAVPHSQEGTHQAAPRGCREVSALCGLTPPLREGKGGLLPPALTFQEDLSPNAKAQSSPQLWQAAQPRGKPWGDNAAPGVF